MQRALGFALVLFLCSGCDSDVVGPNRAPIAVARGDQFVAVNMQVTLDASESYDPDDDPIQRYEWSFVSVPAGLSAPVFEDHTLPTRQWMPAGLGLWVLSLRVFDGQLYSSPDVIRIQVGVCRKDSDCNDKEPCNGSERCVDEACQPGENLDCNDANECTLDSCELNVGCSYSPVSDGQECGSRFCDGINLMRQLCQSGNCADLDLVESCDDTNVCTSDACDPQAGCSHTQNQAACDDGDVCSSLDVCADGLCNAGPANLDEDQDSYIDANCAGGTDCNDKDPQVHPNAFEGPVDDSTCSDQIDNDCDGQTDAADQGCQGCDTDADCSDDNICNGTEVCVQSKCERGSKLNCNDDSDCTGDTCDPISGCGHVPLPNGTECGSRFCDSLNWKRQTCQEGQCTGETLEQACDDNQPCTQDQCDTVSGCSYQNVSEGTECGTRFCSDLIWNKRTCAQGSCSGTQVVEDCADESLCTQDLCVDGNGCSSELTPGLPCETDNIDCTRDECDDQGTCQHIVDETVCDPGQTCLPICFASSGGCAEAPTQLGVACEHPVDLDIASQSICHVNLVDGQNTAQQDCLQCEALVGRMTLFYSDFGDDGAGGGCDLDGWELSDGYQCYDDWNGCPNSDWTNLCCGNPVCPIETGSLATQQALEFNGTFCEKNRWRLTRVLDLSDYRDLRLCFDYAAHNASEDEGLQVSFYKSFQFLPPIQEIVVCDDAGPRGLVDTWWHVCLDVPEKVQVEDIRLSFYFNADTPERAMFIDNISMTASLDSCLTVREVLFEESFATCPSVVTDFNGWTVNHSAGEFSCSGGSDCYQNSRRLLTDETTGELVRTLDTSGYHEVQVCFYHGDDQAEAGDSLTLFFDPTGSGSNWIQAYALEGDAGPDKTCGKTCINLSQIDNRVNQNPNLKLRFALSSSGGKLLLDQISVRAAPYCQDQSLVSVQAALDDGNDNVYPFTLQNHSGDGLHSAIRCEWNQSVEGDASVEFVP